MGDYWTNPVRHPEDVGVGHIRRTVEWDDAGLITGIPIGALEAGAIPLRAGVLVQTAFNAGTTNVLVLGSIADDDGLVTSVNAGAGVLGVKVGTGAQIGIPLAANTVFYAKYTQTGTAASAGKATLWVEYLNKREVEGTAFPAN
jgi:hypothetical protein